MGKVQPAHHPDYKSCFYITIVMLRGAPGMGDHLGDAHVVSRGPVAVAEPAGCNPESTTIDLRPGNINDPNEDIFPHCTRALRCGGCCSHDLLACQPIEIEMKPLSIIKWRLSDLGDIEYGGKEVIEVEMHTKCECGCKTKPTVSKRRPCLSYMTSTAATGS